jgi:multiple sugar transport system ATP-binding protein
VSVLGATFPLPWALRGESSAPRDVLVGIRPDDLNPAGGAPAAKVRLGGQVDVCEQTGTAIYATIQCADAVLVAKLPRHPVPAIGEQIELAFDPKDIHLFDGETQDSLLDRSAATSLTPTTAS